MLMIAEVHSVTFIVRSYFIVANNRSKVLWNHGHRNRQMMVHTLDKLHTGYFEIGEANKSSCEFLLSLHGS